MRRQACPSREVAELPSGDATPFPHDMTAQEMTAGDDSPLRLGEEEQGCSLAGRPLSDVRHPSGRGPFLAVAAWGPWLPVLFGAAWSLWSWQSGGVVYDLLRTDLDAAAQVERLRAALAQLGGWAPAAYVALVTIECVVAPIPGLLLYAPGGMIFGPWLGGALSLTGNVCGAGLAAAIARRAAARWRERFLNQPAHLRLRGELERRGAWWVFWLRVNPLTSSDLVSYAAGLAGLPPGKVMLATAVGMAPLCFVQSAVSHEMFRALPALIYPFAGLCVIYVVVAVYLVRRAMMRNAEEGAERRR
jgi:uncharacterized membrane protein YdjX (TVP38/TMEM64 family)